MKYQSNKHAGTRKMRRTNNGKRIESEKLKTWSVAAMSKVFYNISTMESTLLTSLLL